MVTPGHFGHKKVEHFGRQPSGAAHAFEALFAEHGNGDACAPCGFEQEFRDLRSVLASYRGLGPRLLARRIFRVRKIGNFPLKPKGGTMTESITAAMLVIGDEILSGRTQDTNLDYIAKLLGTLEIDMREARVVPEVEEEIVNAVNTLRARYTYVFTTGGIGPTHDDITADAIAKAFGVGIDPHPEAMAMLGARYQPGEFNEMRKRMARIPDGATLIKNSASTAPGFQIGNVFVMAGVPMVMRAMMEDVGPRLRRGAPVVTANHQRPDRGGPNRRAPGQNPE